MLFFLKTHPDVFTTCSLLSWAWYLLTVEKAGSEREKIGAQLSWSQVWSVLTQYCTYLVHVAKIRSWRLVCYSQLGDLAAKLPLSLNTFLLKLADFPNLLPSLHQISNEREWDNVREGSKQPNYYFCLPSVICLEGSYTFSWSLPAVKCNLLSPLCPLFPPHWRKTENTHKKHSTWTCGSQVGVLLTCGRSS